MIGKPEGPSLSAPDQVDETIRAVRQFQAEHRVKASPEFRAMRWITDHIAQPQFVIGTAVAIGCWIAFNALAPASGHSPFDVSPFQWLQAAMTLASLFMVVFILAAQKHEDELNDRRDMLALDLAILSEQKSAKIIRLLEEFRRDSPEIHDRVGRSDGAAGQPAIHAPSHQRKWGSLGGRLKSTPSLTVATDIEKPPAHFQGRRPF
jgi:uncharacterized membrane protein